MDAIRNGYIRIGAQVQAVPLGITVSDAVRQKLAQVRAGQDNDELITEVAEQDYALLTGLVRHAIGLPTTVLAALVRGVAQDWTTDPNAARTALLTSLDCQARIVQYEAMEGLDEMWRESDLAVAQALAQEVAKHPVAVERPAWVGGHA